MRFKENIYYIYNKGRALILQSTRKEHLELRKIKEDSRQASGGRRKAESACWWAGCCWGQCSPSRRDPWDTVPATPKGLHRGQGSGSWHRARASPVECGLLAPSFFQCVWDRAHSRGRESPQAVGGICGTRNCRWPSVWGWEDTDGNARRLTWNISSNHYKSPTRQLLLSPLDRWEN